MKKFYMLSFDHMAALSLHVCEKCWPIFKDDLISDDCVTTVTLKRLKEINAPKGLWTCHHCEKTIF